MRKGIPPGDGGRGPRGRSVYLGVEKAGKDLDTVYEAGSRPAQVRLPVNEPTPPVLQGAEALEPGLVREFCSLATGPVKVPAAGAEHDGLRALLLDAVPVHLPGGPFRKSETIDGTGPIEDLGGPVPSGKEGIEPLEVQGAGPLGARRAPTAHSIKAGPKALYEGLSPVLGGRGLPDIEDLVEHPVEVPGGEGEHMRRIWELLDGPSDLFRGEGANAAGVLGDHEVGLDLLKELHVDLEMALSLGVAGPDVGVDPPGGIGSVDAAAAGHRKVERLPGKVALVAARLEGGPEAELEEHLGRAGEERYDLHSGTREQGYIPIYLSLFQ